jgi:hypothetical protein
MRGSQRGDAADEKMHVPGRALDRDLTISLSLSPSVDRSAVSVDLTLLADHKNIFQKLEAYKELMHWLQRNKFASYLHLAQVASSFCMPPVNTLTHR